MGAILPCNPGTARPHAVRHPFVTGVIRVRKSCNGTHVLQNSCIEHLPVVSGRQGDMNMCSSAHGLGVRLGE